MYYQYVETEKDVGEEGEASLPNPTEKFAFLTIRRLIWQI
jgi:hypothetical protein